MLLLNMNRQSALVLTLIFFILFAFITYYGAHITLFSTIVFSVFLAFILLNLFYPVSQLATDSSDFTLVIYACFEILSILLLALYILCYTLTDIRTL